MRTGHPDLAVLDHPGCHGARRGVVPEGERHLGVVHRVEHLDAVHLSQAAADLRGGVGEPADLGCHAVPAQGPEGGPHRHAPAPARQLRRFFERVARAFDVVDQVAGVLQSHGTA